MQYKNSLDYLPRLHVADYALVGESRWEELSPNLKAQGENLCLLTKGVSTGSAGMSKREQGSSRI